MKYTASLVECGIGRVHAYKFITQQDEKNKGNYTEDPNMEFMPILLR
jgi:hypothetical protein